MAVLGLLVEVTSIDVPSTRSLAERHAIGKNLGLLDNGLPLCTKDGVWTENSEKDLNDLLLNPDVQCWRDPPCIRPSSYITTDVCKRWPKDDDWPTWDPHTSPRHGAKTFGDAIWDFLTNKTVVIIGDSIGAQVFLAAVCEAARSGLHPYAVRAPYVEDKFGVPLDPSVTRRIEHIRNVTESTPILDWVGGTPQELLLITETGTILNRKGWHKWGRKDMEAILSYAEVLLVNYGLHYAVSDRGEIEAEEYVTAMREMFEQVKSFSETPGKAFLFRETGVEHGVLEGSNLWEGCTCGPLSPSRHSDNAALRRNKLVEAILRKFPSIPVVPFYNITVPAHDIHEGAWCSWDLMRELLEHPRGSSSSPQPMCCDCTHFCYTPQFWGQFYDDVYLALERSPGLLKSERREE